jgi:hypothetical protein
VERLLGLAESSITLTSSRNPSPFGQPVTFTARVTAPSGTPTGTVNFLDWGRSVLLAAVPLTGNEATFTTRALQVGTDQICANYLGDFNFDGSFGCVHQTVNPGPPPVRSRLVPFRVDPSAKLRSPANPAHLPPSTVQEHRTLAAGGLHTLALRPDGAVWAWGQNFYGELGAPDPVYLQSGLSRVWDDSRTLVRVGYPGFDYLGYPAFSILTGIVSISAGSAHSLALAPDGSVWAWGDNSQGQAGPIPSACMSADACSNIPQEVPGLPYVVAVSAGAVHSLAVSSTGTVLGWGRNGEGQLGNGTAWCQGPDGCAQPGLVKNTDGSPLGGVVAVAAGALHSLALRSDGTVWTWGSSPTYEPLGDGTTES